jgi:hypothetical protein
MPELRLRRSGNNLAHSQKFTPYWSNYIFQIKSLPLLQVTDTEFTYYGEFSDTVTKLFTMKAYCMETDNNYKQYEIK